MSELSFADIWEQIADAFPDAPAQIHGERRQTWREFDRGADGVARRLLDLGVEHQDKVAQYLYNGPEYLQSVLATFKASLVPVNTNYRYVDDELVYLWDNADAVAVVFHGTFVDTIERIRARVPGVRLWLWVDDGSGPCPAWAERYDEIAASASGRCAPSWGRSGEDIYLGYTGGTTGLPKGVMWRQGDLIDLAAAVSGQPTWQVPAQPGPAGLAACPLMHGTGLLGAIIALNAAGRAVTLTARSFDPVELLDTIERERVNALVIVGDVFAKPMLAALDAFPGRWDISSLALILSAGVMFSAETKQGLLKHHPNMVLQDALGSSEALGMGQSISTGDTVSDTAKFTLGPNARVITEDGIDVAAGSGQIGMVAVSGVLPIGYYKDPGKTARTFREIDGVRYSLPGDYATIEADGSLRMLGRGSVCINTGGEKVFPEEVEEVLKTAASVRDAAVVGVPDSRWGEAVVAVVEPEPGADVDESALINLVKSHLAPYKAPKRIVVVDSLVRSPAGKLDYPALKQRAISTIGG